MPPVVIQGVLLKRQATVPTHRFSTRTNDRPALLFSCHSPPHALRRVSRWAFVSAVAMEPYPSLCQAHQNQVTALCSSPNCYQKTIASAKTERGHGNQKKNIGERSACWLEGLSLLVAIAASPTLLSLTAIVFHRGQREIIFGIRGYQRQLPQCKSKCTLLHLLYSRERMSQEKRRNVGIGRPRFLHCMCFLTFHRLECNSASLFCPRHDQQTIFDRGIFDFRSRTCMCTSHSFQLAPVGLVSATRCQFSASVL